MTFVLQFTEPRTLRRMFENSGLWTWLESSRRAGGEQQPKRTQSRSSWNGQRQSRAAAEVDTSGEQQLKQMQAGTSVAVEMDRCNHAGSSSRSGRNRGAAALHGELRSGKTYPSWKHNYRGTRSCDTRDETPNSTAFSLKEKIVS